MRLLVVGGGPAGATAAMQAGELGADVTLLEAEQIGGTNLNRGPAPVRTLARAARLARDWSSWERFGLEGSRPVPNLEAVQVVAVAMRSGMNVEQLAEMQFAYPTFTEAVSMAAQKVCRSLGIGHFPPTWSYLGREE